MLYRSSLYENNLEKDFYLCKWDLFLCLPLCWLVCQDALSLLSLWKFSVPLPFPSPPPFWWRITCTYKSLTLWYVRTHHLCYYIYGNHVSTDKSLESMNKSLILFQLRKSLIILYLLRGREERCSRILLCLRTNHLYYYQRSERISTWCQHLQFGAFWGALRQQILEYLDRGNFVVLYLYIRILRTVFAPSGAFIQIERLRLRQVWSMMTCSKHINREKPWLLTCKNHTNSRTLFFLSKKMLLCRDVREFLYQFDDRKK